jgi:DNA primase
MPLRWEELKLTAMPKFYISDFEDWHSRLSRDPWAKLSATDQSLTAKTK